MQQTPLSLKYVCFYQAQTSHLIAGHVVLLKIVFSCFHLCSVNVQQLSHWRSCPVGRPQALCLFINWTMCLKRLRVPSVDQLLEVQKLTSNTGENMAASVAAVLPVQQLLNCDTCTTTIACDVTNRTVFIISSQ